jgi:hypothetical protein
MIGIELAQLMPKPGDEAFIAGPPQVLAAAGVVLERLL